MRPGSWLLAIGGGLVILFVLTVGGRVIDSLDLTQRAAGAARFALATVSYAVFGVIINRHVNGR